MSDEVLKRDDSYSVVLGGVTNDVHKEIRMLRVDPTSKRLLVAFPETIDGNLSVTGTLTVDNGIVIPDQIVILPVVLAGTVVTTGDFQGDIVFTVPEELNTWTLVSVGAAVTTAGTTGTTDIQIHNITQAVDMLSTKITIDSGETDSSTAATPPVIDTSNDDVATGDQIRVDVDAVSTTPPEGLFVRMAFRKS